MPTPHCASCLPTMNRQDVPQPDTPQLHASWMHGCELCPRSFGFHPGPSHTKRFAPPVQPPKSPVKNDGALLRSASPLRPPAQAEVVCEEPLGDGTMLALGLEDSLAYSLSTLSCSVGFAFPESASPCEELFAAIVHDPLRMSSTHSEKQTRLFLRTARYIRNPQPIGSITRPAVLLPLLGCPPILRPTHVLRRSRLMLAAT